MSESFGTAFSSHPNVSDLVVNLLFRDSRALLRKDTALLICHATGTVPECERYRTFEEFLASNAFLDSECFVSTSPLLESPSSISRFRSFFWPLVSELVKPAFSESNHPVELLRLCFDMFKCMRNSGVEDLNVEQLTRDLFDILLRYTTTEVSHFARIGLATS